MKRVLGSLSIAVVAMFVLTACNPPMPPSVAAQIAEQTYTCIEGEATVSLPESMNDLSVEWLGSMQSACAEPAMSFALAEAEAADLVLSSYPVTACTPVSTVPVAVEAADIAFSLSYSTTLNLTPGTLAAIFNGEITMWNDPAIAKENPETEMPELEISLRTDVDRLAFEALKKYTEQYGHKITAEFNQIDELADATFLEEGQMALMPHSVAFAQGFTTASMIMPEVEGEAQLANADSMSIGSAATQWTPKQEGDNVSVTLDYGSNPEILSGLDAATPPYQLIYPVYLNICNDTLLSRAVAFFFLRMHSQGSLGVSVFTQLPERTRVVSLVAVKRGLPVPTAEPGGNG